MLINMEHKAGEIEREAVGQASRKRAAKLHQTQPCGLRARLRALSSLDPGAAHKVSTQAGGRVVRADKDELSATFTFELFPPQV